MPSIYVKDACFWGGAPVGSHYVCLSCRVAFKQYAFCSCPNCGGGLYRSGLGFRVPRKGDKRGWRIVETMLRGSVAFHSNWGRDRGKAPKSPREAVASVENYRRNLRNRGMIFLDEHPRRKAGRE